MAMGSNKVPPTRHFWIIGIVAKFTLSLEKKTFWSKKESKDYFEFLDNLRRLDPGAKKFMEAVTTYPSAKTTKGKGRLWMRLALKEKKLKDYLSILTSEDSLLECVDPAL